MRSPRRARCVATALLALLGPVLAGAGADPGAPTDERPALRVVTTLYPLEQLARELGGDRLVVTTLVPPGATPHTFEPRPRDVERLAAADAFLRVGGGLDGWTRSLLGAAPQSLAIWTALEAPDLELLRDGHERGPEHHGGGANAHNDGAEGSEARGAAAAGPAAPDPHVWLDPLRVRDGLLPALEELFARLDPPGRAEYARQREAFEQRLTALDRQIRQTLARAPGRQYVALHNAWRYFADRYGLEEVGVVHEFAGAEPSPRAVAQLVRAAREAEVPALLVEPQLAPRMAEVVGSEFGAELVVVDPLGDPEDPQRRHYEGLLRFNARAFAEALGRGAETP